MINVMITDDHKLLQEGITSLLQREEHIQVVAVASNGQELLERLQEQSADVILLDINMPVMDGLAACKHLQQDFPETRVIALSMMDQKSAVQQMIQAGAWGFLLKNSTREELVLAIETVASGQRYIGSQLAVQLLENTASSPEDGLFIDAPDNTNQVVASLSKAERKVLPFIAAGFTNSEIAEKLFNSPRTIESHRQSLLHKTHCPNTAALVRFAARNHLL